MMGCPNCNWSLDYDPDGAYCEFCDTYWDNIDLDEHEQEEA